MSAPRRTTPNRADFHFGIEAEFLLVEADTCRPLWHPDLTFEQVYGALEAVDVSDLGSLEGLELEPPHRKLMPYVVEGYHMPDPSGPDGGGKPHDLLVKGVEIRTPVCGSIEDSVASLETLYNRMQSSLRKIGLQAAALSHHPTATKFEGPQNKRRYDFWRWAMEVMTTYGPDMNVSLPVDLEARLNIPDLLAKCDYYGPAITALSLASPFCGGEPWEIRGRIGKSFRTHRRSVFGQLIELHPEEDGRMEFKPFEATNRLDDYAAYFLFWLELLLDDGLTGRASYQSRVYDLGQIARDGLETPTVVERASEILDRAPRVLEQFGFNAQPLEEFRRRLETRRLPADDLLDLYEAEGSIEGMLRHRTQMQPSETFAGTAAA